MKDQLYSEKVKQAWLRKYSKSDLTISRFCLREGISQAQFRSWLKESPPGPSTTGGFVPLRLVEVDGQWFPVLTA